METLHETQEDTDVISHTEEAILRTRYARNRKTKGTETIENGYYGGIVSCFNSLGGGGTTVLKAIICAPGVIVSAQHELFHI